MGADEAIKGLTIAAGVIITCVIISMAIFLTRQGQEAGSTVGQSLATVTSSIKSSDLANYTSGEISGSDALNFVRKHYDEVNCYILVRTSEVGNISWKGTTLAAGEPVPNFKCIAWIENGDGTFSVDSHTFTVSNKSVTGRSYLPSLTENNPTEQATYVNPYSSFRGYAIRNDNDVVTDVYFVQVSDYQVASNQGNSGGGNTPGGGGYSGGGGAGFTETDWTRFSQYFDNLTATSNTNSQNITDAFNGVTASLSALQAALSSDGSSIDVATRDDIDDLSMMIRNLLIDENSNSVLATIQTSLSTTQTTLSNQIDALQTQVQNMSTSSGSDNSAALEAILNKLNEMNITVNNLPAALVGLETKIDSLSTRTDTLSDNVKSLSVSSNSTLTKLDRIDDEIAALALSLNAVSTNSAISSGQIYSRLEVLVNAIAALRQEVLDAQTGNGAVSGNVVSSNNATNSPPQSVTMYVAEMQSISNEMQDVTDSLLMISEYCNPDGVDEMAETLNDMKRELEATQEVLNTLGEVAG